MDAWKTVFSASTAILSLSLSTPESAELKQVTDYWGRHERDWCLDQQLTFFLYPTPSSM